MDERALEQLKKIFSYRINYEIWKNDKVITCHMVSCTDCYFRTGCLCINSNITKYYYYTYIKEINEAFNIATLKNL